MIDKKIVVAIKRAEKTSGNKKSRFRAVVTYLPKENILDKSKTPYGLWAEEL